MLRPRCWFVTFYVCQLPVVCIYQCVCQCVPVCMCLGVWSITLNTQTHSPPAPFRVWEESQSTALEWSIYDWAKLIPRVNYLRALHQIKLGKSNNQVKWSHLNKSSSQLSMLHLHLVISRKEMPVSEWTNPAIALYSFSTSFHLS